MRAARSCAAVAPSKVAAAGVSDVPVDEATELATIAAAVGFFVPSAAVDAVGFFVAFAVGGSEVTFFANLTSFFSFLEVLFTFLINFFA